MLNLGDTMPSKTPLFLTLGGVLAAWFLQELDEDSTFVQFKRSNKQWLNGKIQAEVFKKAFFKLFKKT